MKPTYEYLIQLNQYLINRDKKEIESLVDTIIECGYEWHDDTKWFWNPKIRHGIKTGGLDMFNSNNFKYNFDNFWNNPIWRKGYALRQRCVKIFLFSILLFFLSIISFLFLNWKVSLIGLILSIVIAIVSSKIKDRSLRKERYYEENKYINIKKETNDKIT